MTSPLLTRLKASEEGQRMPRRSNTADALPNERLDAVAAVAETVLYALAGLVLARGGFMLVGKAAYDFVTGAFDEGSSKPHACPRHAATHLHLHRAVQRCPPDAARAAPRRRAVPPRRHHCRDQGARPVVGDGGSPEQGFEQFRNGMIEIGVVVGVVLVLSICALLLRRSRREPSAARSGQARPELRFPSHEASPAAFGRRLRTAMRFPAACQCCSG